MISNFTILQDRSYHIWSIYLWSRSTSECDYSDHPVSVIVVVFVVSVNFFGFSTSLKPLHEFASNFVGMFLGWTPTNFVKIGVLPLFLMELLVILCNFWPIIKKYCIKPLTRNHSYFVLGVPRGLVSSLFKVGHCDLYLRFKLTIFVKHIFDFSQTAAQILMKFGSNVHLSKVTQVYSDQGCKTYFCSL